ncbi:LD18435p [Strongyloides ratti]|uniref:poly(A)-specific ribonuclease n=1 Tax=Strongyloides ratti TaxID=34506 RepID=A0A090MQ01_STRRB|nr:LD18435p [Strongyloides ratti]CEF60192.1 LD18435p [Strongyloides ratti]
MRMTKEIQIIHKLVIIENDEFKQLCFEINNDKRLSSNLEGPSNRRTPINEGDERLFPYNLSSSCGRSKNNSPLIKDNESKTIYRNAFMSLVSGSLEKPSNISYNNDPLNYINCWSQRINRYVYPDDMFTGHKIYSHFPYPDELSDNVYGKLDYPMGNITHNYIGIKNIESELAETLTNNEVNNECEKDLLIKYKIRNRIPNPTNVCQAISIACELRNLPSYVFDNIKNSYITTICLSNNLLSNIPDSIGVMTNLKYLDISCNKLVTLPKTISKCYNLITLDVSNNLITHFPDNLGLLKKKLEAFYIYNNPIRHDLMHVLTSTDPGKVLLEILQKRFYSKQIPPPRREWTFLAPPHAVDNHPNLPFISVMTYNILSYKYLFNNRFNYCPDEELKWEYRKAVIFEEISHYSPAIVTMQEVPKGDYETYFHPKLCENGYDGLFFPKSRIKKTKEELTQHVDGCAIFWQKPIFSYILHFNLEFKSMVDELFKEDDERSRRIQSFDNVALVVVLTIKGEEPEGEPDKTLANGVYYRPLVIATTHIHWDPEYADVKLIQSMLLMKALYDKRRFISHQLRCNVEEIPIIITGDFNSRPRSSVLEYIKKKQLRKDDEGLMLFKNCENLDRINSYPRDPYYYHHGLKDLEMVDMSKYEFTNFTPEFSDVIDYIFYTSTTLSVCGIIEPPSSEWIKNSEVIGFPHPHFPSDHIPIVANFYINKEDSGGVTPNK